MSTRREPAGWLLRLGGGAVVGALGGLVLLTAGIPATGAQPARSQVTGLRDVLHSPPLLLDRGQSVRLRYEVVCQSDELGTPCPVTGTLFVRPHGERGYRRFALQPETGSSLTAELGSDVLVGSGFAYYAVIEDGVGGSRTVPAGGAAAPQQAWVTTAIATVDLGVHTFGRTRAPDRTVARAAWGAGPAALGLIGGKDIVRIGPSAFDIAPDGSVVVLDQLNDRLAVYPPLGGAPRHVPIPFTGAEGDVAVDDGGTVHVLDLGAELVVRSFSHAGTALGSQLVRGGAGDMLRVGPGGPLLHGYPGDMWFPLRQDSRALTIGEQAARARPGLAVGATQELVVRGGPREARFALVAGDRVVRAWRLTSATDLGEIQHAEPLAGGLLVVLRVWTESEAEFVAVVLEPSGAARTFSVDAVEWAESAALGRFRTDGRFLYQLRSAPNGVEIVAFDLGGAR